MRRIRSLWGRPRRAGRLAPAWLAFLPAMLVACASVPDRPAAATFQAPGSTQTAFAAAAAEWPTDRWWTAYGDAQLNTLIDEALTASPTLVEAQARLRAAEAGSAAARAAAGPRINANANVVAQEQSQNAGIPAAFVPNGYEGFGRATLDFSYELDFWGRNRAAIAAAASQTRASAADLAQARLVLSTAVAAAYADLARLNAERDIAQRALDVRTQTVDLVAQRVKTGLDTMGEQRQAEAGPPLARADIAALDEATAQTRNRIAALLGAGPDRGLAVSLPTQPSLKGFGLPQTLSADLIGRRPDLVAARWRADAAAARTKEARAAFYPNINLVAFVGTTALGLDNLVDAGSRIGSAGPALSLPLFDSGRLGANLSRADAERDGAVAAYNATLTEALREIADVAASERALTTRLDETRTALAASEDAYRIARQRYEGGLATYQTVLIAEDAVLAQRRAVAALESRRFTLDVALVRALGGGFKDS